MSDISKNKTLKLAVYLELHGGAISFKNIKVTKFIVLVEF